MKPVLILSCLFLACASSAVADDATSNAVTFVVTPAYISSFTEELRTNHPALHAAGARADAARADLAAVRTWEDPTIMLGGMVADTEMRAQEGDVRYGVEQKLPLFGKATRKRGVARAGISVEEGNFESQFQLLRRDLAKAMLRAAFVQRAADIGVEDLQWLEAMVATTGERYRVGDGAQAYLLRALNERARRADQLITDRRRLDQELATVNRLLGRSIDAPWPRLEQPPIAGEVPYSPRLIELSLGYDPRLQVLHKQTRRADAAVEEARRERYPDVSLGLEGRNYSGNGEFRQGMVTVSVSVPWVNGGHYGQDVRREAARRDAAGFDVADYELGVREELRRLTLGLDAARREALLYRDEIIPRSEQALASVQGAWTANRAVFLDVMEARRMLVEARLMLARAVDEQYQMITEVVLCCGLGDLESLSMLGAAPATATPAPAARN